MLETKTTSILHFCEIKRTITQTYQRELLLGDCLDILPKLPDKSVDTILTDPPFFVPAQQYVSREQERWQKKFSDLSVMKGFFDQVAKEFGRLIKPKGHCLVFCDPVSYPVLYPSFYNQFDLTRCLIWYKGKHYFSLGQGCWRHSFELILHGRNTAAFYEALDRQDVIECAVVPSAERLHPAQKPVKLMRDLLKACTPANGTVLDAFCGSGSTLVACKELGLNYIGVEADSANYDVAKKRLDSILTLDEPLLIPEPQVMPFISSETQFNSEKTNHE